MDKWFARIAYFFAVVSVIEFFGNWYLTGFSIDRMAFASLWVCVAGQAYEILKLRGER